MLAKKSKSKKKIILLISDTIDLLVPESILASTTSTVASNCTSIKRLILVQVAITSIKSKRASDLDNSLISKVFNISLEVDCDLLLIGLFSLNFI